MRKRKRKLYALQICELSELCCMSNPWGLEGWRVLCGSRKPERRKRGCVGVSRRGRGEDAGITIDEKTAAGGGAGRCFLLQILQLCK